MININDGMGGGTMIRNNSLFNSCRESGDHGEGIASILPLPFSVAFSPRFLLQQA
jgi:hypothetical protein